MIATPPARANPGTRTNTTERRPPLHLRRPSQDPPRPHPTEGPQGTRSGRTRRAAPVAESVSTLLLGHQGHHRTQPPMLRSHRPAIPRPTRGRRTHPASRGLPARTSRSRRPAQPHRMAHPLPLAQPQSIPSRAGPRSTPQRPPPKAGRRPTGRDIFVSPSRDTFVSPGETKMTPKISLEVNQDGNQTTTTRRDAARRGRPTSMHAKSRRRLSLRSPRTRNPDRSRPPRPGRRHPSPLARSPRPRIHARKRSSSPPPCRRGSWACRVRASTRRC